MSASGHELAELFNAVYAEHHQPLYGYFAGHTSDTEAAADLLQETYLRVWRNVQTLQTMPPDQHRYWLFAIGRNVLTDHYRRESRLAAAERPLELVDANAHADSAQPAPDTQVEQADTLQRLNRAISDLPEQLRVVLAMQVLGEMNSSEIGAALDMPAGTVRYHLSEARKRLAGQLRLSDVCVQPKERR